MFGDMWAETYGSYKDYHVDPDDLVQTCTCLRCGREGKSTDDDIHSWLNVNICEVDTNIWSEENDAELCPDCASMFNDIWFDFIVTTEKMQMIDSIRGHREIDLRPRRQTDT